MLNGSCHFDVLQALKRFSCASYLHHLQLVNHLAPSVARGSKVNLFSQPSLQPRIIHQIRLCLSQCSIQQRIRIVCQKSIGNVRVAQVLRLSVIQHLYAVSSIRNRGKLNLTCQNRVINRLTRIVVLDPATSRLTVECSTNWTTDQFNYYTPLQKNLQHDNDSEFLDETDSL